MGNNDEVFKLADGSIWEVKYEYEYLYEYAPDVIICPDKGKLIVDGKQLNVRLLSAGPSQRSKPQRPRGSGSGEPDLIETQIMGSFSGWDGETIFKFTNGQIWQQSSYAYAYHYSYSPKAMIFKVNGEYQLQVEGVDGRISVARLK